VGMSKIVPAANGPGRSVNGCSVSSALREQRAARMQRSQANLASALLSTYAGTTQMGQPLQSHQEERLQIAADALAARMRAAPELPRPVRELSSNLLSLSDAGLHRSWSQASYSDLRAPRSVPPYEAWKQPKQFTRPLGMLPRHDAWAYTRRDHAREAIGAWRDECRAAGCEVLEKRKRAWAKRTAPPSLHRGRPQYRSAPRL